MAQVYFENFSGEANGATSGTAVGGTWSTTPPSGGVFARIDVGAPYGGILYIDNTGTEGIWRSNVLNISALGDVALEVVMGGNNATAADYVRAFYRIDGGPEVMFSEVFGSPGLTVFTASSAVVSGNTLEIVIRGRDNSGGGGLMGFDDVTVTDIAVLYSRGNGNWNNVATWSTNGFGGGSCACTPNADTRVIIGNNRIVNFNVDGSAAGVEIQGTGTLQWTGNNLDLTVERGGAINILNGGTLTRVATTASTLQFGNYTYAITNAGTLNIGAIVFNSSGNSVINNSGTLTVSTATGFLVNGGNGYVVNNTGTFNVTTMDLNNGDVVVNNSGTINQSGNFTDIDTGSDFNNLTGGVWNWSTTPNTLFDTDMATVLDCTAPDNTFNYNGAGAQRIIPGTYDNLTLSNSGAKDANNAAFSVRGDWLVSGTATFTEGTGRVTFSGVDGQTITNPAGETFYNMTINNTSATSPQITMANNVTVSNSLTMTDGNVNLNGTTFTLSSAAAAALSHTQAATSGWMYGGSLVRSFPTTAIASGNVAGFYPLGGATDFRPFFIDKNNSASSNGTATITYNDANTATDVNFLDGATTVQRRHDSFWRVTKTGMTLGSFNITAGGTGFTIGAVNETRLTRANDALTIGTAAASFGTAADVRVRRTGLTGGALVNDFYVASTNKANTPLPIELVYFRARVDGDAVITTWKTAREINNDFFTVQKTTDFETFHEVGIVRGKGDSKEEASYNFVDDVPFTGKSYYRLKQTDFDGTSTYSDPVMVDYQGPSYAMLSVYPNPLDGKLLNLELRGVQEMTSVPVYVIDQRGMLVMELEIDREGPGVFRKELVLPDALAPGLYILRAGKTRQLTIKLIVR